MFRRMLIANRGEIAVRIIRACRELGIEPIVAYSEADRDSLAVRLSDQAVCFGPGPSEKSYLSIPNVVSAALTTGCEALHPGYGFLSENSYLAEVCEHCNLTFVGPPAQVLERFSNKIAARQMMKEAGLPVVPGSDGSVLNLERARDAAAEVGFPVILKAAAGGGGRGMRRVSTDEELVRMFPLAVAEAQSAFGNGELYVERFLSRSKHIEMQIAADRFGNVIHLGNRDCSLQRRHQKMLEEAPAGLPPELREEISNAAINGARAAQYQTIGTMEFLVDSSGGFYFIEMNCRLQVEHAVTEFITGLDLVKLQIQLAAGEPLPLVQDDVTLRGHAIEARILAEDAAQDFSPEFAPIREYQPPGGPGVRIDSHIYAGYSPPPYYDSLLGKLITWGRDRTEAIARMDRALEETHIVGPKTTIPFLLAVLRNPQFQRGQIDTEFGVELLRKEPVLAMESES